MRCVSPVYSEEMVECEKVIALDQPEYAPIIALPLENYTYPIMTRWEFTEEERKIIANGGHLLITELTFNHGFTPLAFEILKSDQKPQDIDVQRIS